jgi:Flp pilus assembly protein TadD
MLRGDYKMARKKLAAAQAKDPDSKFIQNNIELLNEVSSGKKGIKSP